MAKPYNGHRSWNAWNVALWIGNDEGLYSMALDCLASAKAKGPGKNLTGATSRFMRAVSGDKTPDGAVYNRTCVKEALAGLE